MTSGNPSYVTKNRLGIYIFQYKIPEYFRRVNPSLGWTVRKSLHTRNKRKAIQEAKILSIMMDELAKQYFNDATSFAKAVKLLQEYKDAQNLHPTWQQFEEHFLIDFDDYESHLLEQIISYRKARLLIQPSSSLSPDIAEEAQDRLLEAIKNQHTAHIKSIPITDAFEKFLQTTSRAKNWKGGINGPNANAYRKDQFAIFHALVDDISTGELTKQHSSLYLNAVLRLPGNRVKKYPEHPIQQLIEMDIPAEELLSQRSREKYLQRLSTFLQWLQNHDYAVSGINIPLQGAVKPETTLSESDERPEYTCQELTKLFNSEHYKHGLHKFPHEFWVPLIGLFSGARQNEICQLYIDDVYQEKETGIWVFDINQDKSEETNKSIKKGMHARLVPIHPKLIDLGFIEFYETIKKMKHKRVFMELKYKGHKNKFADKFQRWYNNTYTNKNNCNITSKATFHSLRHKFINELERLDIPLHRISAMVGQKPDGGVTVRRYIKPIDLQERHKLIKKLNYKKCIDFSAIRSWKYNRFAQQK